MNPHFAERLIATSTNKSGPTYQTRCYDRVAQDEVEAYLVKSGFRPTGRAGNHVRRPGPMQYQFTRFGIEWTTDEETARRIEPGKDEALATATVAGYRLPYDVLGITKTGNRVRLRPRTRICIDPGESFESADGQLVWTARPRYATIPDPEAPTEYASRRLTKHLPGVEAVYKLVGFRLKDPNGGLVRFGHAVFAPPAPPKD